MKRKVLTSIVASAALVGAIALSGCGGSSNPTTPSTGGTNPNTGGTNPGASRTGTISIATENGVQQVDPSTGGTVVINRNNQNNTNTVATVVHSELNDCASTSSDSDGDGVICGPKEGVTYVFQTDFGKLGPIDTNISTPDGGALLFDAKTAYNGTEYDTPVSGNQSENRIQEVYIPTNYIKLASNLTTLDQKYNAMRSYLANVCNMQCMSAEPNNNPYFTNGKTSGTFLATYVMWFTRGTGEDTLKSQFATDTSDLEYLTVEFPLTVTQVDGNSSKLKFTVPAGGQVVFGAKKHNQGALEITTTNDVINEVLHESQNYVHSNFTINMAKYFDKLIAKGDSLGVSDYAKDILVENAQHPWPVKIYGVLHEKKDDGTYQRSFIRNPGKLDANLFHVTASSDENASAVKAEKFNIVYPGGNYNTL